MWLSQPFSVAPIFSSNLDANCAVDVLDTSFDDVLVVW